MSNLAHESICNQMNELEARREALREELRQVETKMQALQEVEPLIESATAQLAETMRKVAAMAPDALEAFHNSILAAMKAQRDSVERRQLDLFESVGDITDAKTFSLMPAPGWNASGLTPPLFCEIKPMVVGVSVDEYMASLPSETPDLPLEPAQEESSVAEKAPLEATVEQSLVVAPENADSSVAPLPEAEGKKEQPSGEQKNHRIAEFVALGNNAGYVKWTGTGEIVSAYLGGKNKTLLSVWGRFICKLAGSGAGFQVRDAERLKSAKHELKLWGISFGLLQKLATLDISKSPKFSEAEQARFTTTSPRPEQPTAMEEMRAASDEAMPASEETMLGIADKVQILSDRQGFEFVDQTGTVSLPSRTGAVVNVRGELKYFHYDEIELLEKAPERNPSEDLSVSRPEPIHLTETPAPW